jgi:hypothetical protein
MRSISTLFSMLGLSAVMVVCASLMAPSAEALSSRYGCYEVTANSLNIRAKAWSRSKVLAVAKRGGKLAKRRRFCALRGFWCPVTTEDGVDGWAGKRFLKRAAC